VTISRCGDSLCTKNCTSQTIPQVCVDFGGRLVGSAIFSCKPKLPNPPKFSIRYHYKEFKDTNCRGENLGEVQLPNNHCRNIKVNGEFNGSFKVVCDQTSGNTRQITYKQINCQGQSIVKELKPLTCIDDGILSEQPYTVQRCNQ
jgi:hypothetical protein